MGQHTVSIPQSSISIRIVRMHRENGMNEEFLFPLDMAPFAWIMNKKTKLLLPGNLSRTISIPMLQQTIGFNS